jgi:hypothetical protein
MCLARRLKLQAIAPQAGAEPEGGKFHGRIGKTAYCTALLFTP